MASTNARLGQLIVYPNLGFVGEFVFGGPGMEVSNQAFAVSVVKAVDVNAVRTTSTGILMRLRLLLARTAYDRSSRDLVGD